MKWLLGIIDIEEKKESSPRNNKVKKEEVENQGNENINEEEKKRNICQNENRGKCKCNSKKMDNQEIHEENNTSDCRDHSQIHLQDIRRIKIPSTSLPFHPTPQRPKSHCHSQPAPALPPHLLFSPRSVPPLISHREPNRTGTAEQLSAGHFGGSEEREISLSQCRRRKMKKKGFRRRKEV
ncbi:unnamed protein product [Moneuplotes crassus]|uniref:Uncharacterized protein n=1 Tax=Euplotes crassus TaxID=5936 RepID=A0AAD1U1N7_EUPCR|nr:unnamed protein product [Moneuplotes crassus]